MESYKKINLWSVKDQLIALEKSSDFIMPDELKKMQKAVEIKKTLNDLGYFTEHYKKEKKVTDIQSNVNYVFKVKKGSYTYGEIGDSFYVPVFKIWKWLLKSGEVEDNEFIRKRF
tara:strand:+ start:70 stop:414 length:345 start_codon:yes stop_codon:yes gene_type:complete